MELTEAQRRAKEDKIIHAILKVRYWGTNGFRPQLSRISEEKRKEWLQLAYMVHEAIEQEEVSA